MNSFIQNRCHLPPLPPIAEQTWASATTAFLMTQQALEDGRMGGRGHYGARSIAQAMGQSEERGGEELIFPSSGAEETVGEAPLVDQGSGAKTSPHFPAQNEQPRTCCCRLFVLTLAVLCT